MRLPNLVAALAAILPAFLPVAVGGQTPEILTREQWGASPAIESRMVRQDPREIIVHHTGIRQNPNQSLIKKLRGVQYYGQNDRKWGDMPYHFYIDMNGDLAEGRDLAFAGDTNTSYDVRDRIQIVLEGHFDSDEPDPRALRQLSGLVAQLQGRYNLPRGAVSGHMDHAATDCPGAKLYPYLAILRGDAGGSGSPTSYSDVQRALAGANCYVGSIDGQWGPQSRAALDAFNSANGTQLRVDSFAARQQAGHQLRSGGWTACR